MSGRPFKSARRVCRTLTIHGTDDAVRRAGENIVKKLPRGKRDILYDLINSPAPLKLVQHIAANRDD